MSRLGSLCGEPIRCWVRFRLNPSPASLKRSSVRASAWPTANNGKSWYPTSWSGSFPRKFRFTSPKLSQPTAAVGPTHHPFQITRSNQMLRIQWTAMIGMMDRIASAIVPAARPQTRVPQSSGSGLPRCHAVYDSIETRIA